MSIFRHMDSDGDEIEVLAGTYLEFHTAPKTGGGTAVHVDREAVQRLHNALGEWLYPQNLGPNPAEREAAVKALHTLAAGLANVIRPLWSEPVADKPGCYGCTPLGCTDPSHGEPIDPEPHDVGHPEPEPLCTRTRPADAHPASRCTFCGHLWSDHAAPLAACICTHRPMSHTRNGCLAEDGGCPCLAVGPDEPQPTPLERVREFYRSTLSPDAVVPECGLCKQPWSDTHGQPENPCAGAPRQLVGCECGHGWGLHSESDRVGCFARHGRIDQGPVPCKCKRTRPAVHKIECDECGHRWTLHPPAFGVSYCVQSTNGVLCGCKCTGVVPRVRPRAGAPRVGCECGHGPYKHDGRRCTANGCTCRYAS